MVPSSLTINSAHHKMENKKSKTSKVIRFFIRRANFNCRFIFFSFCKVEHEMYNVYTYVVMYQRSLRILVSVNLPIVFICEFCEREFLSNHLENLENVIQVNSTKKEKSNIHLFINQSNFFIESYYDIYLQVLKKENLIQPPGELREHHLGGE